MLFINLFYLIKNQFKHFFKWFAQLFEICLNIFMCLCCRPATFRSSASRVRRSRQEDARKWRHSAAHTGAARTNHPYCTISQREAALRLHRQNEGRGELHTHQSVKHRQFCLTGCSLLNLLVCYRSYFFSDDCSIYRKGTCLPLVEIIENCIGAVDFQHSKIHQLTFHF